MRKMEIWRETKEEMEKEKENWKKTLASWITEKVNICISTELKLNNRNEEFTYKRT